ncbi:MAG TPA: universal stress protein [Candidatus Binatia bacterium]|jgi:nucleotide-binding universal stress UspA family protein
MATVKKILASTDFSELSAKGVHYACQLAKDLGAQLIVMNIVLLDESGVIDKHETDEHKKRLDEFVSNVAAKVGGDLRIRKVVDAGQPYATIVSRAAKERVDLIVMSSHGRSGLSRMLIGSVTDKVLRASHVPVLVVPSGQERD